MVLFNKSKHAEASGFCDQHCQPSCRDSNTQDNANCKDNHRPPHLADGHSWAASLGPAPAGGLVANTHICARDSDTYAYVQPNRSAPCSLSLGPRVFTVQNSIPCSTVHDVLRRTLDTCYNTPPPSLPLVWSRLLCTSLCGFFVQAFHVMLPQADRVVNLRSAGATCLVSTRPSFGSFAFDRPRSHGGPAGTLLAVLHRCSTAAGRSARTS